MTEPKIIYKYTHAQAVADGELTKLEPFSSSKIVLYISKDAQALRLAPQWIRNQLAWLVLTVPNKQRKAGSRYALRMLGAESLLDAVFGIEIRDDDKIVPCITVVTKNES